MTVKKVYDWESIVNTPTTLKGYGVELKPIDIGLALGYSPQRFNETLSALSGVSTEGFYSFGGGIRHLEGTVGQVGVVDGDGVKGNPTISLARSGVAAGTYSSVTVDIYGRVTSGLAVEESKLPTYLRKSSEKHTYNIAPKCGTTLIYLNTEVPVVTMGAPIMGMSIHPMTLLSKIRFSGSFNVDFDPDGCQTLCALFFRGDVCIGVSFISKTTKDSPVTASFTVVDMPATVQQVNYSIRVGTGSAGVWYINQSVNPTLNSPYLGLATVSLEDLS